MNHILIDIDILWIHDKKIEKQISQLCCWWTSFLSSPGPLPLQHTSGNPTSQRGALWLRSKPDLLGNELDDFVPVSEKQIKSTVDQKFGYPSFEKAFDFWDLENSWTISNLYFWWVTSSKTENSSGYLNINLCYECFRDVKVQWIRRYDRQGPGIYLPWMLWRPVDDLPDTRFERSYNVMLYMLYCNHADVWCRRFFLLVWWSWPPRIWNGGNLLLFLLLVPSLLHVKGNTDNISLRFHR